MERRSNVSISLDGAPAAPSSIGTRRLRGEVAGARLREADAGKLDPLRTASSRSLIVRMRARAGSRELRVAKGIPSLHGVRPARTAAARRGRIGSEGALYGSGASGAAAVEGTNATVDLIEMRAASLRVRSRLCRADRYGPRFFARCRPSWNAATRLGAMTTLQDLGFRAPYG